MFSNVDEPEEVKSTPSIPSQFQATLTNLSGANDLLMDDIVDDMKNGGNEEHQSRIRVTVGGPEDENGNEDEDTSQSTTSNDDVDIVYESDYEEFDGDVEDEDDDDVIGGYETLGGKKSIKHGPESQPQYDDEMGDIALPAQSYANGGRESIDNDVEDDF